FARGNAGRRLMQGCRQAAADRSLGEGKGRPLGQAAMLDLALELLPQAVVLLGPFQQSPRLEPVRGEAEADPRARVPFRLPGAFIYFIENPVVLAGVHAQVFVDARERRRGDAVAREDEGL